MKKLNCFTALGTHDIQRFAIFTMFVETVYSESSCAAGAMIIFVFLTECRDVHFTKSAFLALNRATSLHYTLPDLYPGEYRMLVYDVESDGTLANGLGYPAVNMVITRSGHTRGT